MNRQRHNNDWFNTRERLKKEIIKWEKDRSQGNGQLNMEKIRQQPWKLTRFLISRENLTSSTCSTEFSLYKD